MMGIHSTSMEGKFRLRTILLIVNLTVLLLPLFGLIFFRLYENELVRQTEMELISQAAVLSSIYKKKVSQEFKSIDNYGRPVPPESLIPIDEFYTPVTPVINLSSSRILPPRPDGIPVKKMSSEIDAQLTALINDVRKTTLSGIKILDYNGIVIAGSEAGRDFSHVTEIENALKGLYTGVIRQRISDEPRPALASISRGTNIRLFIAFPIIKDDRMIGVIYVSRTPQNIFKHLYEVKEQVFIAFVFILILTLLIATFTSYTISKPIYRLIAQIKFFAKGDENTLVPLSNPIVKEVELLSKSFSQMANSLQERSGYIRNFATHVSHEFKTPLTSIQGAAELLEESGNEMTAAQKEKFFSNIQKNCQRLEILVGRLLELARADNLEPIKAECNFLNILLNLKAFYKERKLEIFYENVDDTSLVISKEYLEVILTNLFENSLQHGATAMTITTTKQENYLQIAVADNGTGISQKNRDKIFTPFFTTNRSEGGTGLGLGIIKSLLKAHDGNIYLAVTKKQGAVFILTLPI